MHPWEGTEEVFELLSNCYLNAFYLFYFMYVNYVTVRYFYSRIPNLSQSGEIPQGPNQMPHPFDVVVVVLCCSVWCVCFQLLTILGSRDVELGLTQGTF